MALKAPAHLPSIGQRFKGRLPKPSRLDRILEADKDRKLDERRLRQWSEQVRTRDKEHCRVCRMRTTRSLMLTPTQGQAHHIMERAHHPTRYDVRNGLWCCGSCHLRLETHMLTLAGTAWFELDGRCYLDASAPVTVR